MALPGDGVSCVQLQLPSSNLEMSPLVTKPKDSVITLDYVSEKAARIKWTINA